MRVALVGLGKMGALFPNVGVVPRSHLAAIVGTPSVELCALVDTDIGARDRASALAPDCPAYADLRELPKGSVDLVVDARPPAGRAELLMTAASLGARAVLLEKPLATSLEEAKAVCDVADASGLLVRVNFHRRFDPAHVELRSGLASPVAAVMGFYNKGLMNYGSHLIDLLLDWVGPVQAVRACADAGGPNEDPSIGFDADFGDGRFAAIRTLPQAEFDVFEVTMFGREYRIDLFNGGAGRRVALAKEDLYYPGYRHLAETAQTSSAVSGLRELYGAFGAGLSGAAPVPGARVADALAGMQVLSTIRQSHSENGNWLRVMDPRKDRNNGSR